MNTLAALKSKRKRRFSSVGRLGTPRKAGCRCVNCDTGERKPHEFRARDRLIVATTTSQAIRKLKKHGAKGWLDGGLHDILCVWADIEEGIWR